ncbi:MAG: acetylglutamate kinase [Bacillota bacterium]|nr:acetylglutamate kinase [Bacillota bacterium]
MGVSGTDKAAVLIEALPYIQKYNGKIVVIKYGGNAMVSPGLKNAVIRDIVLLTLVGVQVVLVHGGGPEINDMLKKTGKEPSFVNGQRYTDKETMDIVQMVLCGKVNKDLVASINRAGGKSVGLCGLDGELFKAVKLKSGCELGLVGEIKTVNAGIVNDMLQKGYIPVISTIAEGIDGNETYNVNADIAASKLAVALSAEKLILLTDVRGILENPGDENSLIKEVQLSAVPALEKDGIISGGMIPKVECCVEAMRSGVRRANIQDGRVPHSILIELLSDEGVGTMFI